MRNRNLFLIVSLVFAGLTIFLGYFVQRADFYSFIAAYGALFAAYAALILYWRNFFSDSSLRPFIWMGIGLRVLLLFSIPNLSDDYARFLWDGHLTIAGIHPFLHPPSYFIDHQCFPGGITPELFHKLNSPNYYTVYPPVCQAVFAIAAWCFPDNLLGGVFVMKLCLLGCEIGTIGLLERYSKTMVSKKNGLSPVLLYALNPLAIMEISGNCHFEGAMIFALVLGNIALSKGEIKRGAVFWALATACKMLPLMFLPIAWRYLGWRSGFYFILIFGLACLLLFLPLAPVLPNMVTSLDLYFRQFQFNASFYYLIRELGFWQTGWDIGETSGPVLGGLTLFGVLVVAARTKKQMRTDPSPLENLSNPLLFASLLYLSFSATVQPWYILVPLAISMSSPWRFAVVWTGLTALSYSHYQGGGLKEKYGWIVLEYLGLWGFIIWEFRRILFNKPAEVSS